MNKILIAPDSFKGTLSSMDICEVVEEEILHIFPGCEVISVPIADGGEGTVDSFLTAVEGEKKEIRVSGPYFEKISSYYGLIDHGKTAIIEMAAAAGLPMVSGREDPSRTTTFGVGELIAHAAASGAEKIIIGLGGSCTNDGGCGLAAALGVKFYDNSHRSFIPTGENLGKIAQIDNSKAKELLSGIRMYAMCDVTNPLYGPNGAAAIFGPQKEATPEMVDLLDENLRVYGDLLDALPLDQKPSTLPGAGAAGGLGAGLYALLDVPLVSGIEMLLNTIHFEELLEGADLVITGEGQIDSQSLGGKAVFGVAKYAKLQGVPVCVLTGQALDDQLEGAYDQGISGIFTINRKAVPFSESKVHSKINLRHTIRNILHLLKDTQ